MIKDQETSGLQSSLGIKAPLNKTPFVGPLLFCRYERINRRYKMNKTVNKFILACGKFIPGIHL